MISIVFVRADDIGAVWPMFKRHAEKVVPLTRKRRCYTGLLMDLMKSSENLWLAMDGGEVIGFCTSAVVPYDEITLLQVRMLAGDRFDEWIDQMHDVLEDFARENGCGGMELIGRRGWVRKLDRFGWNEAFTTVEKRFV